MVDTDAREEARQKFEAAFRQVYFPKTEMPVAWYGLNEDGSYCTEMMRASFELWQAARTQAPSEQKWIRQGACSECDNDGCAKCDPVGTIRKICSGEIQVGDDAEDALKSIAGIVDAMSEKSLAGTQSQAAQWNMDIYTMTFAFSPDFRHVLLLQKSSPIYQGKWSSPGGKVETGESELEGALREMAEETGIALQPEDLRFSLRFSCNCNPTKEREHAVAVYGAILPYDQLISAVGLAAEPVDVFEVGKLSSENIYWYVEPLIALVLGRLKELPVAPAALEGNGEKK